MIAHGCVQRRPTLGAMELGCGEDPLDLEGRDQQLLDGAHAFDDEQTFALACLSAAEVAGKRQQAHERWSLKFTVIMGDAYV
jgi:hypothetical protein